jgi:peptidoglycan hydrolase-like protein with peptidoglycan-binding domain
MRRRPFTLAIVSSVLAVAALGGVAYGTGFASFADRGTAREDVPSPVRTSSPTPTESTSARPTPTTSPSTTPTATASATPTHTPKATPTPTPKPRALMKLEDRSDDVRELEARLHQLDWLATEWVDGYYGTSTRDGVKGFQARRGMPQLGYVDAATWDRLVAMTHTPTRDELYPPKPKPQPNASALDPRCTTGRAICVDKSTRTLRWVVDGSVRLTMDVRFGCQSSPTREGAFTVRAKVRDGYSNFYDTRMPFSLFFSGHQAVHYSDDFAARGYNGCSHGCVNVRSWDTLSQLFDEARVGDKVIVYWS